MSRYLVVIALMAAIAAIAQAQFNMNSVSNLMSNPQISSLLSQVYGGPQGAQAAANGQCVNSQNMLANTLICSLAGQQCGASMGNNPLAGLIQTVAGGLTSQLASIVGSNPIICVIVKQSCCLSQTGNNAQLAGSLANVLLNGNGGGLASLFGGGGGGGGQNFLQGLLQGVQGGRGF